MIRILALGSLVCLLAACDSVTAPEHHQRAVGYFEQEDYPTAIIELKNALQKDPELIEARFLLGRSHAVQGRYQDALREFERVLDQGPGSEVLTEELLRVKNRLGRSQEVIGELEERDSLSPTLAVILADAYLAGEDFAKARPLYQQAEALAGGSRGLGTIAWVQGDLVGAREYLRRAVVIDPADRESWIRNGELELSEQQYAAAADSFSHARDLPGGSLSGGLGLARTYLAEDRLDVALTEISAVLAQAPALYLAHYVDALIKYGLDDIDGAEAALRQVQRVMPDHTPSLYLMGAVKYRQGQLNQAEGSLLRYLSRERGNESAAKLLAAIRVEKDDLAGAIELLEPFTETTADPQLLAMLGTAKLKLGQTGSATRALERAVMLAPDAAAFRNQLALSLLSSGDEAGAVVELESAIAVDEGQFQSDYLLAMLNLKNRDFATAAESARNMTEKSPQQPLGYNLLGAALLGGEDEAGARAAFEQALQVAPDFLPAADNLARLDEAAGDRTAARGRYQAILDASGDHAGARLAMADLAARSGDRDAARQALEAVLVTAPDNLRAQLGLIRLHLQGNQLVEASEHAQAALRIAPESVDVLLLNAELALAKGDPATARRYAEQLQSHVSGAEPNRSMLVAVGALQQRVGLFPLARRNLEQALAASPGPDPRVLQELVRLDIREQNLAAARARLDTLQSGQAASISTRLLAAQLLQAQGLPEQALVAFAELAEAGSREAAIQLARLRLGTGRTEAALAGLDSWLTDNPADLGAKLLRAEALMRKADKALAIAQYEELVDAGNPLALNNLAWLYMERNDQRAVALAEQAQALAPANGDIADTFGWILVQFGQPERAINPLRQSSQQRPENASIRYHLGVAYLEAGRIQAGRLALQEAVDLGDFPEQEDARRRLEALSSQS